MVNRANMIHGRHVDRHPMSDQEGSVGVYTKDGTVLGAQALQSGTIETAQGQLTFQPGDWILTDNPPTHAWPMREDVFRSTYTFASKIEPGQMPTSEPFVIPEPDKSVPPTHTVDNKLKELGKEIQPRRSIATAESLGMEDPNQDGA